MSIQQTTTPEAPPMEAHELSRKTFPYGDARDWFLQKRFGMFIHWGIYAVQAYHEQAQVHLNIPPEEYAKLAQRFNPVDFDPDAWIDLAQEAGMEYLVFTTKHHDGFCMWDTKQTDFNVMNTPYGRDIVKMLAEACHRRGMKLGLYYSCVDWHQPNYPNAGSSTHELPEPKPGDKPDWDKYIAFVCEQVKELCGGDYGEIGAFWWDMNPAKYEAPEVNELIRQLQPGAVINGRGFSPGDYTGMEREYTRDESRAPFPHKIEACNSVGIHSWGFKEEEDFYTLFHLESAMARILMRGGNYLLNVGPDANGVIQPKYADRLRAIGRWFKNCREALIDVELANDKIRSQTTFASERHGAFYLALVEHPIATGCFVPPFQEAPKSIILLNNGKPVDFDIHLQHGRHPMLRLRNLPVKEFCDEVMVLRMVF